MAAATMYEVSTQVIWSCELCSAPCMCGSATLAIVVSSACMIVASMMETVIIPRWGMRWCAISGAGAGVRPGSRAGGGLRFRVCREVGAYPLQHRHQLAPLGRAEAGEGRFLQPVAQQHGGV